MALLTPNDIQQERNIDLTDPNGPIVASALIDAAIGIIESQVGYKLEVADQTAYFSRGERTMYLPTRAPVSNVVVQRRVYGGYEALPVGYIDWDSESGEVSSFASLPVGMKAVKTSYRSGWTSSNLPRDLREAIIDMVMLKLQAINNFSSAAASGGGEGEGGESGASTPGQLKKLSIDGYTEEYSTAETDAFWKAKAAQMSRTIGDDLPASIQSTINRWKLVGAW